MARSLIGALRILLATAIAAASACAAAQERIRIMGPSAPEAGFATTARAMQEAMTASGIAEVDPYFGPGDGGLAGLTRFVKEAKGDGRHLMITGYTTIGSILSNRSAVTLDDVTPIARLIKLYPFGLLVSAKSPITNAEQLAAMLKADPAKVSWVAGSVGGAGHTTVVRFAMLNKVDPTRLNFNTSFGEDTLEAVVSGKATVAVSSGFAGYDKEVKAGRLRLIGTTGAQRRPDIDAPTLKEQGFDLVFENWRGVVAPPGISVEQRQSLAALVERMAKSPAWKEVLKKRNWDDAYLGSAAFEEFLKSERVKVEQAFRATGMLK